METFSALTGLRWIPLTKGQWRGALMFSMICARINAWVNNSEAGDLRQNHAHYDVTVMLRLPNALNGLSIRLYPGHHFDRYKNWLTYSLLSFSSQNSTGNKTGHFKNVAEGLKCCISHSNMASQPKHVRTDPHLRVLIVDFNIFVDVRQSITADVISILQKILENQTALLQSPFQSNHVNELVLFQVAFVINTEYCVRFAFPLLLGRANSLFAHK